MILFLKLEENKTKNQHPKPIPPNYLHKPKVWNFVQCKTTLSTFQPKCVQNKMTASLKNHILKGEMPQYRKHYLLTAVAVLSSSLHVPQPTVQLWAFSGADITAWWTMPENWSEFGKKYTTSSQPKELHTPEKAHFCCQFFFLTLVSTVVPRHNRTRGRGQH